MKKAKRPKMDVPYQDSDFAPQAKLLVVRDSVQSLNAKEYKDTYRGFFK